MYHNPWIINTLPCMFTEYFKLSCAGR